MKKFSKQPKIQHVLESIRCDVCSLEYDDPLEMQEFLSWTNHCGYASVFGDLNTFEIDVCQHCLKKLFKDYARVTTPETYGEIL